ncbi:triple tyrosine motif-containing protein [Flagellimonas sp. CMM7]|uniref:helix-turn-helix and ligand-binding sensor domain-containing protein n=1 Tax=Flagellimonas sp. CMM7 TaxID=2654676 RepID=UPI0013D2DCE6|nr:triple tyrosine motif-containing protein [Flagellimonas sp. CMM7]UII78696.1 LuxR C-terminal-related transcriptional regulator [Flagellimonas sp. CMM7]
MNNTKKILTLVSLVIGAKLFAQELPPIKNYAPSDYLAENQNWDISQAADKVVYVANSKGLLEFNGAKWTLFPSPNETIIRSVKVVDNKIYTGCYMEFGYWQKDDFGMLQYTSLSTEAKKDFEQDEEFWNILDMDQWIVFQSLDRIYIYDLKDNSINTIDSDSSLPKIFNLNQSIYYQRLNKGIFKIENGNGVLVYDDKPFKQDEVINIFQHQGDLLVLTRHNGFYKIQDHSSNKWNVGADTLLSKVSIYSALELKDGGFVLGTISHGLIYLDRNGNLISHIDQVKGLRNNTVLSIYEDFDNNIWLGLDNGISYLNLKSAFKVYHDSKGVAGSVYASVVLNNILYLGTNQGLFYKELNSNSDFRLINSTQGQVWSLNIIGQTLFCGHHTGTFIINENKAKRIADIQGTWNVSDLNGSPNLLLQGNYDGLYVLEKSNNEWHVKNKIEGFNHSSRYFETLEEEIFVNHEYKGVFRIEVDSTFSRAKNVSVDTLIKGANSGIVKYKEDLLYSYEKGILKYDKKDKTFVQDSILSKAYSKDEYLSGKMTVDNKNDYLWIFTNSNINFVSHGNLSSTPIINSIPLTENVRNGIVGYESVTALEETGKYLFGTSSGYVTIDIDDFSEQDFTVNIASIRKAGKNINKDKENLLSKSEKGNFKSDDNNLEISFYTADYNKYLKPSYQYQLLDIYTNWSEWSQESFATFENLPPGEYTFNVKSKIGDRISNNIARYSFKIARPWYISNSLLGLYLFLAILGSILIHNLYKRHYHKRQQKLIEKNKRDMELAQAQNDKEIIKIKNEQLKEEFRSKSNELAASTLSIIKKNELLSKVKEQLVSNIEDKNSVKPIITIIDKSLNQNDDWELFKEAFNNADRKFLKKLKKSHPNLSPNDIRLCAYLRLNLSSKEIAPLLNISPRSVEIKRYRLRKKMDLTHDDNLVNYILKL